MIDTVSVAQLAPAVLANVPNVPDPALATAIIRSARQFCRKTQIWQEWMGPTDPVEGVTRYQVMSPMDAEFAAIVRTLPADIQDAIQVVSGGMYITVDLPDEPTEPFSVLGAFIPTLDAGTIPAVLAGEWDDVIVAGALAFLTDIPKADWTDHRFAAHQAEQFRHGIGRARVSLAKGQRNEEMVVRKRRFI